jgi:serine/threonine protein kinase
MNIYSIISILYSRYQLPDNVSHSAREFLDACLTKDYHQRPTAEELCNHAFINDIHNHHHHHEQNPNQISTSLTSISF